MSMSAVWPIQFLPADKAASGPSPKVRMGMGIFFHDGWENPREKTLICHTGGRPS